MSVSLFSALASSLALLCSSLSLHRLSIITRSFSSASIVRRHSISFIRRSSSRASTAFIHCASICICCFINSSKISLKLFATPLPLPPPPPFTFLFFRPLFASPSLSSFSSSSSDDSAIAAFFFDPPVLLPPSASIHSILCILALNIVCSSFDEVFPLALALLGASIVTLFLHLGGDDLPEELITFGLHEGRIQLGPDDQEIPRFLNTPLRKPITHPTPAADAGSVYTHGAAILEMRNLGAEENRRERDETAVCVLRNRNRKKERSQDKRSSFSSSQEETAILRVTSHLPTR
nr:hypothetical protein Itr_chr10CG06190 [Ipomoea trifida]